MEDTYPEDLWVWGDKSDGVAFGYRKDVFGDGKVVPQLLFYSEGQTGHQLLTSDQLAAIATWAHLAFKERIGLP